MVDDDSSSSPSQVQLNTVAVGKKYQSKLGDGSKTPWLDNNIALQERIKTNQWKRWDGVEGTVQEHSQWVLNQVRSLTSQEREHEFRPYGTKGNCQYYIHDTMTTESGGYGMFKIEGILELEPNDLLTFVLDMKAVTSVDDTVVLMKIIATYLGNKKGDPFHTVAYWSNHPGFPFHIRDSLDLSTYHRDEDGTCWQLSTCLAGNGNEEDYFTSQGVHATDRLFAYKLVPNTNNDDNGKITSTKVTIISQTVLNGYIPKSLSNYMICNVLIDYMKTIEQKVKERKISGEHQTMLQQMEFN